MVEEAQRTHPGACIQLKVTRKARAGDFVLEEISAFGLAVPFEISIQLLRSRHEERRLLCVRPSHMPGYQETFKSREFSDEA